MTEERTLQLLVRVLTVGGQTMDHRYLLPSEGREAEELVVRIANMIIRAMTPKTSLLVWFDNPLIVYNPDNILGIRTEVVGSEQDKKSFGNQVKIKLGLV